MSIKHAILGFLSYESMTGYDLKKIIQNSTFMHWSGNNNQIYKALTELSDEGHVTNEVHFQSNAPSKKVYTISETGVGALKEWIASEAELPDIKKTFLVQLAWADLLKDEEIDQILSRYEEKLKDLLAVEEANKEKACFLPDRTPREKKIWELIYDNAAQAYQNELRWIQKVRQELFLQSEADPAAADGGSGAAALLPVCMEADADQDKQVLEITLGSAEVNKTVAEEELQRLLGHSIKVATAFEEQEHIQTKYKELLTGFDRSVGLRPGEELLECVES